MIEWIVGFSVATFTFNSIFGFALYWIPLLACFVGYTLRTIKNYKKDVKERDEGYITQYSNTPSQIYSPTDSVGDILGRIFVSIMPIANFMCMIADIAPAFFGKFFDWLQKTFSQPLVPDSNKYEIRRKNKSIK